MGRFAVQTFHGSAWAWLRERRFGDGVGEVFVARNGQKNKQTFKEDSGNILAS